MRLLPFFFLVLPLFLFASSPDASTPIIDSLKTLASTTETSEEKVDLLNKIAFQYLFIDTLQALNYIDSVQSISERIEYPQGFARALNINAIHFSFQGKHEDGIRLNNKALTYCDEDDHFVKGKIYNGLGLSYQRKYIVDKCLEHYQKALFHSSEAKDTMTMSIVLGNIAGVNNTQENIKEAKKYFLQLEKLASNYKDLNVQYAFHIRFAEFLTNQEEYEESKKYLEKGLINAEKLKHNNKIRRVRLQCVINSLNNGQYEEADHNLQSLISPEVAPNEHTYMRHHYWSSELEYAKRNYLQAINHAELALSKIEQFDKYYFYKPRLLKNLHRSEKQLKNYKNAYDYLLDLKSWQDSIDLKEREHKFLELESKYQSEKKEIENVLLQEQSHSKSIKLYWRTTLAIAALGTLLFTIFLAYLLYRNSRKEKSYSERLESTVSERTQKLKNSNEELERFAYITSHDLKEPITTIRSFTQLLKQKIDPQIKTKEVDLYIDIIEKSANQMTFLVNGILDYSKLGEDAKKENVDLNEILQKVEFHLSQLIISKNAKIISPKLPILYCNSIQLFQIFKNLIENGLKYNRSNECMIEIECIEDSGYLTLNFKDNGIGINEKYKDQVFEMFSRLNNPSDYTGTGLGLAIVKKTCTLMGGNISLSKSDANGSTFCLSLPKK